ncbi:MAG TPA: alpha/beta hydrolase fold domain-containing protein [Lacunisphaera sp.]|nr:alpha/beta hydrolase fold domain-containing protein [Lacunisphaera sp.]
MNYRIALRAVAFLGGTCLANLTAAEAALPPLPAPQRVPAPGPRTDAPYAPLAVLPGGVVVPLYPPDSPYLKRDKVNEPEVYQLWGPALVGAVISIHNPSIEFHAGNGRLNTGAVVILAGGGGHRTLNVGEASPLVQFLGHQGVSAVILRNRLRSDGYEPKTDGVNDALQAIKLVRAYARQWNLDPAKVGIMGFSAGAELAVNAALLWEKFDRDNDVPGNPLAKVSSRPDFVGSIYPGPSLFFHASTPPPIPRAMPPVFIACAGQGDWIHAYWATEFYQALLLDGVPNIEMMLYARGRHPGDKTEPGEPPSTGSISNMGGIPYGTWSARFLDWFRDLGFLDQPGAVTRAAKDVAASLERKPHAFNGGPPSPAPASAAPAAKAP